MGVKQTLLVIFLLGLSAVAMANGQNSKKIVNYDGQSYEEFSLTNVLKQITYEDEVVYDTCNREVPYQDNVCNYETRYRQQCNWEPGRYTCRTQYENRCRTKTVYKEVCERRPRRRQCRTVTERICTQKDNKDRGRGRGGNGRVGNGRGGNGRVGNGRGGNGRGGNGGGGQVCRNVTREVCRGGTGRGQRVCRQVPRTKRVCRQVPREVCSTGPSHRVCRQVPRQERVCNTVTRYRTESYTCTRTEQRARETVVKTFINKINVEFKSKLDQSIQTPIKFVLTDNGKLKVRFKNPLPGVIGIVRTKNQEAYDRGDVEEKDISVVIIFQDEQKLTSPFTQGISRVSVNENELSFKVGKIFLPNTLKLKMSIEQNGSSRLIELKGKDLLIDNVNGKSKITVDINQLGITDFYSEIKIKMELTIKDRLQIIGAQEANLKIAKNILL